MDFYFFTNTNVCFLLKFLEQKTITFNYLKILTFNFIVSLVKPKINLIFAVDYGV